MTNIKLPTLITAQVRDGMEIKVDGKQVAVVRPGESAREAVDKVVRAIQKELDAMAMAQVMDKFRGPTSRPFSIRKKVRKPKAQE